MAFGAIGVSSGGNTAGTTGTVVGTYVLQGGNNITLSQLTGSLGTNTVIISGGLGTAGAANTFSNFYLGGMEPAKAQGSFSLGQNTLYLWPVNFNGDQSISCVKMPVMVTNSSSAAASIQKGITFRFGIYSRHSTNTTLLTQNTSTSYTIAASHNSNVSWMLSMITGVGNSTSYNTLTSSSAGLGVSSILHGPREIIMPINKVFTAGEYFMAIHQSSSTVGWAGAVLNMSNIGVTFQTVNKIGVGTAANRTGVYQDIGAGSYSATTAALPATINITQINASGIQPLAYAVNASE